jgi:uncharacterized protein with HEPN domain
MSQRDDRVALMQMLDFAVEAVTMGIGRTRADLERDRMFSLAIQHLVQNIGEAARRVSAETRSKCPGIQWDGMIGMRSRIAHGYDDVNFEIVWNVLTTDLPLLIAELRRILALEPSPIKRA